MLDSVCGVPLLPWRGRLARAASRPEQRASAGTAPGDEAGVSPSLGETSGSCAKSADPSGASRSVGSAPADPSDLLQSVGEASGRPSVSEGRPITAAASGAVPTPSLPPAGFLVSGPPGVALSLGQQAIVTELARDLEQQGVSYTRDRGLWRLPWSQRVQPLKAEEAAARLASHPDAAGLTAVRPGGDPVRIDTPKELQKLALSWGSEDLRTLYQEADVTPNGRAVAGLLRAGWTFRNYYRQPLGPGELAQSLARDREGVWAAPPGKEEQWHQLRELDQVQALDFLHGSRDAASLARPDLIGPLQDWESIGTLRRVRRFPFGDGASYEYQTSQLYSSLLHGHTLDFLAPHGRCVLDQIRLEPGQDLSGVSGRLRARMALYDEVVKPALGDLQEDHYWLRNRRDPIHDLFEAVEAPVEGCDHRYRTEALVDITRSMIDRNKQHRVAFESAEEACKLYREITSGSGGHPMSPKELLELARELAPRTWEPGRYLKFVTTGAPYKVERPEDLVEQRRAFLGMFRAGLDPAACLDATCCVFGEEAGTTLSERVDLMVELARAGAAQKDFSAHQLETAYFHLGWSPRPEWMGFLQGGGYLAKLLENGARLGRAGQAGDFYEALVRASQNRSQEQFEQALQVCLDLQTRGWEAWDAAAVLGCPEQGLEQVVAHYARLRQGLASLDQARQAPQVFQKLMEATRGAGAEEVERRIEAYLKRALLGVDPQAALETELRSGIEERQAHVNVGGVPLRRRTPSPRGG